MDNGSLLSLFMEAVLKTEKQIFDAINPVVEQMGYEIVDVEFVKKNGELNLTE